MILQKKKFRILKNMQKLRLKEAQEIIEKAQSIALLLLRSNINYKKQKRIYGHISIK